MTFNLMDFINNVNDKPTKLQFIKKEMSKKIEYARSLYGLKSSQSDRHKFNEELARGFIEIYYNLRNNDND